MASQNPEFEFDTVIFKEYLRGKLIALFEHLSGKKLLIIDRQMQLLINLSIEYSALQESGIKETVTLDIDVIDKEYNQVVFFIPPKIEQTKRVAKIIKENEGIGQQKTYMLVYWPQRNILCKELLESEGVISCVELKDFSFDLIPLDQDVLSLEMNDAFREMTIENDLSIYNYVAESINRIQLVMGQIQNIYVKGDGAKMVHDIIKIEQQQKEDDQQNEPGDIESLLLFDRSTDLLTPMLTQLIYEGLIDEFFAISGNLVAVDKKIMGKDGDGKLMMQLSSEKDPLLYQVRNLLLAPLGLYLRDKAEQQEKQKEEFNKEKQKNITEKMVQTAKRIKAEQESVQKHVNISTRITQLFRTIQFYKQLNSEQGMINGEKTERTLDYLEAMIQVKEDLNKVMRLLTMRSLIDGGLKQKTYDYFRREIIQIYGFKTVEFLQNLLKAGLFTKSDNNKPVWPKLQESLKLLDIDIRSDDPNPKDPAYTYSGHCPLVARLVETIFAKGTWKSLKSQMQLIPGFTSEPDKFQKLSLPEGKKPIVLIYVLGGVTYGEISAFRLLGRKFNKEVIICTTNITNGTKLIESLRERL